MKRCLYCYEPLEDYKQHSTTVMVGDAKVIISEEPDFHPKCSKRIFGRPQPPVIPYSIEEMSELAKQVVVRSVAVPGVQPKLSMTLDEDGKDSRLTIVGALGGNYIFKPPSATYPQMPENEHLTMRMAGIFGIRTVPSSLIRLKSGELAYITRRIDRTEKNRKIHMLDMYQLLESHDKYKGTLNHIGKALKEHSKQPQLDKLYLFEMVIFSFITGNADMHQKNYSMIETSSGWELAPAYDLLNTKLSYPEDHEDSALKIDNRKVGLSKTNFLELSRELGLEKKQTENAFERLNKRKDKALSLIDISFLSEDFKFKFKEIFNDRYSRLTN